MDLKSLLIIGLLFCFAIFLIPDLETAIGDISISDPLHPMFDALPIMFIGALFVVIGYVVVKSHE